MNNMDLFTQLRQHAQNQPATVASASRHRLATYRKLWSRIERATARLQAEWQVKRGDRVAYCGQAHPDSLVLYIALARSGACLVPLEQAALQAQAGLIARHLGIRLILHDDEASPPSELAGALVKPL